MGRRNLSLCISSLALCISTSGILLACGSEKKSEFQAAEGPTPNAQPKDVAARPADAAPKGARHETANVKAAKVHAPTPEQIDALAAQVIADGLKDRDIQGQLWTALYNLEQWHLMTFPDSKATPPGLNIETHDGKKWVMAFTDTDRLYVYAEARKQLNSDGTMLGMSVPPQTSFDFFEGLQGIEGIRFNEGEKGWFAPMRNLRAIHTHLKKQGKL